MTSFFSWRRAPGFQLGLLTVTTAVAYYSRTTLGPLQETMKAALALTDNQMAMLQGPPLALGVVAAIPLGALIDRGSRAHLISGLSVLMLLSSLLVAGASDFALLFVARCFTGLCVSAIWVAVLSLLADLYIPAQRGRATMVVAFGGVAGMSAAFAFGGELLSIFGPRPNSWRWAMLYLSAPLILGGLLSLAMKEPTRVGKVIGKPAIRQLYGELWLFRRMLFPIFAGFALVGGIADGAAVIWAAPMLSRSFGLAPDRVGTIMAATLLVNAVLGPLLGGAVADVGQRAGGPHRTVTILTGLLFLSVPTALFPVAPGAVSASILLVLFMVLGASFQVAVQALTTIVVPNRLRGSCLALMLAVALILAFGVAPVLVSQLSMVLGGSRAIGKALALVCVTSSAVGAATFLFGRRHIPRAVQMICVDR